MRWVSDSTPVKPETPEPEHPDSLAVQTSTLKTTYAELEDLSSRLAAHLRGLGVGPEVLVPLSVDRTPNQVIAAIAILKAGGAYVPLDGGIVTDSTLAFVISNATCKHGVKSHL